MRSLVVVGALDRRTRAFVNAALRATADPTWHLVAVLRNRPDDPALPAALRRCAVSAEDWARWSPAVHAPSLPRALALLHPQPPHWVVLALAAHRVRSAADAESVLFDLALPSRALPLYVLSAHSLACFSLGPLLRPLTAHLPDAHSHAVFYFNSLLQAIALCDRSRLAADVAIDVLEKMQNRNLALWQNTERVLIRNDFSSPRLLEYLRRRGPSAPPQSWLKAYASLGNVQASARCLDHIRKQCLHDGIPPPYDADDAKAEGSAHEANTVYLRSMRDDRRSAFQYFDRLLKLDIARPPSSPSSSRKSHVDIYDWTTALYAAAHDRTLPASSLLDLFDATKDRTNAYKPTRATYTVVIQGLLWRNALQDAQRLWDEFVREVVAAGDNREMRIDRKALCVGVDLLVQSGRTEEAFYLLEEAVERDLERTTSTVPADPPLLSVHPIHALFTALLRIRRPDVIFYVWTHLTYLYTVPHTNLMLRILLKAAMQASKMDGESLKGTMSWYMADKFKINQGGLKTKSAEYTREPLVVGIRTLLETPTPPSVVGIWANRRSTEVARSVFRGMIYGNWPALRGAQSGGGVTTARAKGREGVLQELARVFRSNPDHFLPAEPTPPVIERPRLSTRNGDDRDIVPELGPPLPTIMPSESTFATYIALLGLSSRAEEIPETLVWMRALGVSPKTETLAVALVFWMEVGLRGPVFEDGWQMQRKSDSQRQDRVDAGPRTEYGALRGWIREWVTEKRVPREEDMYAGIKRVREMREGHAANHVS